MVPKKNTPTFSPTIGSGLPFYTLLLGYAAATFITEVGGISVSFGGANSSGCGRMQCNVCLHVFVIMCVYEFNADTQHTCTILHLLDETCVHLWWLWRITVYGRDISIPMIADHCIFGTPVEALICCAMCIDSLLDLIWFVWFWFDWYDLLVFIPSSSMYTVFLAFFLYLHRKGQPWWWTWPNWRMMWRTGRRPRYVWEATSSC